MAIPEHIIEILSKRLEHSSLTAEEQRSLEDWLSSEEAGRSVMDDPAWQKDFMLYQRLKANGEKNDLGLKRFMAAASFQDQSLPADELTGNLSSIATTAPAHRVHFLRRPWFRYAAAILLISGSATAVVVFSNRHPASPGKELVDNNAIPDIAPGTNRAVLTVDGTQINLSSEKTGINVGNTIAYTDGEKISDAGKLLMLTTPRGGIYQAVLPDGTKAWLNAASSISFPSAFAGEKRQIKVTGEVYLEVARDKSKPFVVDVNGESTELVLGTGFDINAYGDGGIISTTLVSGSIKISNVILKPGQEAITTVTASPDRQPKIANHVDMGQILAWKEGRFNFNGLTLREVVNQLARWYDIQVRFEGKEPDFRFMGEMYRNTGLSEVLKMLQKEEVKCRMEGRTLVIL